MSYIVSIVIPTYHRADRICRCVDSALSQTCNKEVIVVDDNGKGTAEQLETEAVLRKYSTSVCYIVNETNGGGSFARNQGLKHATGKYITFLDDDDEIHPDKLHQQAECLERLDDQYSCCMCGYHKLMKNGSVYTSGEHCQGDVYRYALSRAIYNGSGSNLLVKTDLAKKLGGYNPFFKRNQDLEFMTRLLKDHKLALIETDLLTIHYEIREVSRTYKELVAIDDFYVEQFKKDIEMLSVSDQNAVYQTIALERWRYSLSRKQWSDGFSNLIRNKVSLLTFFRYIIYLCDRLYRKKSYGFKL